MNNRSITALGRTLNSKNRNRSRTIQRAQALKSAKRVGYVPNLFNQYQLDWLNDETPLKVWEKSRRIGATFTESFDSVVRAFSGECNTLYSTYNLLAAKPFIQNCANWCKAFNQAIKRVYNVEIINEQEILNFGITFPNGRSIIAISGDPRSYRGFSGKAIQDEVAFRPDLPELLKATIALTMRGGLVRVLSTHNGVNHPFNALCRQIEAGDMEGSLHSTDFKTAIAQGMYRSMLAIRGEIWTPEKELIWEEKIRKMYGTAALEELDCIPSANLEGQIFRKEYFEFVEVDAMSRRLSPKFTYFDLAVTEEEKAINMKNRLYYYSAFVTIQVTDNLLIVTDAGAVRLDAASGDAWMEAIIASQDNLTTTVIEQEPGATGVKYYEYFKDRIATNCKKIVEFYEPQKSKVLRAIPLVPLIRNRFDEDYRIVINEELRHKPLVDKQRAKVVDPTFLGLVTPFDGSKQPLVNDLVDCFSGCVDFVQQRILRGW